MRSLLGRVILVVGSSLSSLKIYHATPFWLLEFLLKNQVLTLWEFPCMLFVIFLLPLPIIFVFNFCQFDYYVSQRFSPWVFPVWESLRFLDLGGYFLFHVREVCNYNLFKYFLGSFLSLFSFWDPYNANVGVFNVVPEVSYAVFISLFFSLFFSGAVNSTILSSRSLIRFSASVILLFIPSSVVFFSVIVLFISVCLFFFF